MNETVGDRRCSTNNGAGSREKESAGVPAGRGETDAVQDVGVHYAFRPHQGYYYRSDRTKIVCTCEQSRGDAPDTSKKTGENAVWDWFLPDQGKVSPWNMQDTAGKV